MSKSVINFFKPFLLPSLILLVFLSLALNWSAISNLAAANPLVNALLVIMPYLPLFFLVIGILFGFRSHNTGLILNSFLLLVTYFFLLYISPDLPSSSFLLAFVVPLNLLVWSNVKNKFILGKVGFRYLTILLLEIGLLYFFSNVNDNFTSGFLSEMQTEFPNFALHLKMFVTFLLQFLTLRLLIPNFMIYLSLLIVLTILIYQYHHSGNVINAYYFVLNLTLLPGIMGYQNQIIVQLFFICGSIILLLSTIESSLYLAYVDELTCLPGRRKFNESMLNLGKKYTIAMIDVDHFKKFNDTYGHKTGDQALKMVAAKLNQKTEGAKTFRYGGEEFTSIFPGKSLQEAKPILDDCRETIENTPFFIRDKDRNKQSEASRGTKKTSDDKKVKITVSIGAAQADKHLNKPEKVLKAADKILYKAKHLGRNRVEI